jgi:hypothetical protein
MFRIRFICLLNEELVSHSPVDLLTWVSLCERLTLVVACEPAGNVVLARRLRGDAAIDTFTVPAHALVNLCLAVAIVIRLSGEIWITITSLTPVASTHPILHQLPEHHHE